MDASPHLPGPAILRGLQLVIAAEVIEIRVSSTSGSAACPVCGQPSARVHSRYRRTLTDLPWHGTPVRLSWEARRFFCDTISCPRRIFTERLPDVAAPYARKTTRLAEAFLSIGLSLGGEAGSRLAHHLGMATSGDSLLRMIRRAPHPSAPKLRVLGVDDWAWRRGRTYGTILCDLERHRPVDLLPDRSAEILATWLRAHPEPEIITRDRAGCYAQGAATGAPHATQVADRWHLLHNLRDALKRLADRHLREIRDAARVSKQSQQRAPPSAVPQATAESTPEPLNRQQQEQAERRARRQGRYELVLELHRQGISQRTIGRQLRLNRETVRRYLRAGAFPERARRTYSTLADPFDEYIAERWKQGCHSAAQIARELKDQGFEGSYYVIRRRVARWRDTDPNAPTALLPDRGLSHQPSARRVAGLLLTNAGDLAEDELAFVEALKVGCDIFRVAADLAQQFATMMKDRAVGKLDEWFEKTHQECVPAELRTYAEGLMSDGAAVRAALSLKWSNGQVEGQVNRLKMIKRQMYGRAGLDLLRQRVLYHG